MLGLSTSGVTISPDRLEFSAEVTSNIITITAESEVLNRLLFMLSGSDSRQFLNPDSVDVIVRSSSSAPRYAMDRNLETGILEPSCCIEQLYNCPTEDNILISSSCSIRITGDYSMTLPGISFLRNGRFTIPVSMRPISLNFEDTFVSNFTEAPCNPCDAIDSFEITDSVTCSSSNAGRRYCYCYQLSAADIVELVQNEAIAQNFFLSLAPMTPPWLTINVFPSQRAHLEDSYITYIDDGNNLVNENLCVGFHDQDITDGLYSILKYRGDLGIVLDSDSVSHTPTGSSLFCFAVNNCEGYNSSILISLPEGHNFDSLPLFQAWKRHGWTTQLRGMTVNIQNDRSYDISLWNGYSDASFTLGPYHLSASGSLLGEWTVSDTLVVNFTTDGFFTVSVSDVNEVNTLNLNLVFLRL